MIRLAFTIFVALALPVLAMAGCGSSADGEAKGSTEVSKAELIKQADAICEETDKEQNAAIQDFERGSTSLAQDKAWREDLVVTAGLPPIQEQAEELRELTVPSGDEEEIEAIVDALERAVDQARADPGSMLEKGSVGPFTEVFDLAKEYGFKACATPI